MIDFETIPDNTFATNQYESIGVRIVGTGVHSGLVISEGTFGSQNFGNSPTQIMHIGERNEPTTIRFVDPANPSQLRGATSFSVRLGDGDTAGEDFSVKYFDLQGTVLATRQYTTAAGGLRVGESSASLGATIGSVELQLLTSSPSGAAADDLTFQLYAPSQGYGFTKIAEAPQGGCSGFGPPAINDSGKVAFDASAFLGCGVHGLYVGDGGPLTTIADVTGAFSGFGQDLLPDINESGLVAFYATTDAGLEGFFVGDGTVTATIVDSTPDASGNHWGNFSGFRCCGGPAEPALSGDGRVFFKAYAPVGGDGIHWGDGNVIQSLYQASNTGITEYGTGPSVNDFGTVAFLGWTSATDQTGYYAGDGGPLITVVENGNNFGVGGGVAINGLSHVVHGGFDANLGAYVLRRWDGGPGEVTLADTLGQFEVIFYAYDAINDSDEVSFFAKLDNGEYGVWTTRDLGTPVIKQGDPLFGSVVTSASPSRRSLNNRGQVAFRYELADGRIGVAIATPSLVGCANGLDDDADGKVDSADFGCSSASDTSERSASFVCDDGVDNDGDGLTDFPFDPGCAHARGKKENPVCNDGLDNDNDGFIDFPADTYCTSASSSNESAPPPSSGGCGIGPELALAMPLLAWARRRRCASL